MEPLLSATQVSSYLGISKRSLETLVAKGEGPRFLWVGGQRRWAQQELIDWTLQRTGKALKETQLTYR
ncbi:helix-turn-helix transcriptional regulator [Acidovorax temperans]|uniref:helix-turn-helix transcriptional regulator n=1 Tax=Acidovorax temperans TaxID=80878 RepID=UPI003CC8A284